MDFEALKRLDKNKDTVKKIDRYIQTLSVDSNDYYKATNKVLINSNKDLIKTNSKNKQ